MRQCSEKNCDGNINIEKSYSFKGYLIAEEIKCNTCSFSGLLPDKKRSEHEQYVNTLEELSKLNFAEWEPSTGTQAKNKYDKIEEIAAQHILKTLMPQHELIKADIGLIDGHYDLLAKKDGHNIAMEISQAINKQALEFYNYLRKEKHSFFTPELEYDWIIHVNKNNNLSKKKMKYLIQNLKSLEIQLKENKIDSFDNINYRLKFNSLHEVINITDSLQKNFGITNCYAEISKKNNGFLKVYLSPEVNSTNDLIPLFKIIHNISNDNFQKLELAATYEKHLFIPIIGFENGAAWTLQEITKIRNKMLVQEIKNGLELKDDDEIINKNISVIWIATLYDFNKDGKICFNLAKIVNDPLILEIQSIFQKTPYIAHM